MNTSDQPGQRTQSARSKFRQRKGVALILVVSFIVLLSALVVGFFSRVTTDLNGARSYAEGISARQLAESAVSVVMGQIRAATTITNGCWASQPGMIRVYGGSNGIAGSQAYRFYKLYSSHNLVVTNFSTFSPTDTSPSNGANVEVPIGTGGWSAQPAFFVDLNQPAEVPKPNNPTQTDKRYPIFDPSVARIKTLGQNVGANAANLVEGCEVNITDAQTLALNNAPMPVRWIYVLRDGTLTAPTPLTGAASGNTGLKAIWNNVGNPTATPSTGVPSKDNPIVGRIAFWADDDTCKVNINTAGGYVSDESGTPDYKRASKSVPETNPAFIAGSFWDTPRVQTYFDRGVSGNPGNFRGGLASSQPVRNEFQRYPGHPATTSLGLVMKGLIPSGAAGKAFTSELLYQLTPRLTPGASQGGSKQLVAYDMQLADPTEPDPPANIKKTFDPNVTYKSTDSKTWSYHLLGSVDEMYYTTLNIPDVTTSDGTRTLADKELKLNNIITPKLIDQSRFFLTAHSRSPELNLLGRPRVTIWPAPSYMTIVKPLENIKEDATSSKTGIRNATDDLIRFCSTIGANPNDKVNNVQNPPRKGQFIFDREDPYSSTADFNRTRNREIFSYLQDVTSNGKGKIPGWGQSFEGKYAAAGAGGRDQILTEIFDYIRASVNLKDTSLDQRIDKSQGRVIKDPSNPPPQNGKAQTLKAGTRYAKQGFVVPTRTTVNGNPVAGFGRSPTISEVSIVLYHGGYIYKPKAGGKEDVEYDFNLIKTKAWTDKNDVTEELIRAFVLVETFDPMQGYGPVSRFDTGIKQRLVYEVTNMPNFQIQTPNMAQPSSLEIGKGATLKNDCYLVSGDTWAGRNFGGTEGFFHTMQGKISNTPNINSAYPWGNTTFTYPLTGSVAAAQVSGGAHYYPFQSPCDDKLKGVRIPTGEKTLNFTGGTMHMQLSYVDNTHTEVIQKFEFNFPTGQDWPVPITEKDATQLGEGYRADTGGFNQNIVGFNTNQGTANWAGGQNFSFSGNGGVRMPYYLPLRINWAQQHSNDPWSRLDSKGKQVGNGLNYRNRFLQILQPGDTIRSLVPGGTTSESTDPRTVHLQSKVTNFKQHPDYNAAGKRRAQTLRCADGQYYFDPTNNVWFPNETTKPSSGVLAQLSGNTRYIPLSSPDLAKGVTAKQKNNKAADFDTGIGNFPDGGFCGKADEGNLSRNWKDEWGVWHYVEPYFSTWTYDAPGDTYFSPNRQIPSPVMFGSLLAPNTTMDRAGWKTLLFCPNPAAGYTLNDHEGFKNPPDHLLLDLFNMPVVEPYAISEPFSTDGKVNLNYQLMPFGYIERSTALRAALHPLRVTAIPTKFADTNGVTSGVLKYKGVTNPTTQKNLTNDENLRCLVDRDETIKGFKAFYEQFSSGATGKGFFKSASQVCEMFLYPKGMPVEYPSLITFTPGDTNIKTWWDACSLTGDNVREKPYSDLYSRVTTKSNTYTVHYRVQSLRQRPYNGTAAGADAYYGTWDESRDQVLSEYRGHTTIERYLDPRDDRFYKTINPDKDSLEGAYRFRVIYNKRFSPW